MIKRTVFVAIATPYIEDSGVLNSGAQYIYGVFEQPGAAEEHWSRYGYPGTSELRVSEETVVDWDSSQVR